MSSYRLLFIGDVVGRPGREALAAGLPQLRREHDPLFIVVNGENSAGGVGITKEIANEIFQLGADVITLGNHAFNKRDIFPFLDSGAPIIRPANIPPGNPGKGITEIEKNGVKLAVMNLCGRVYMDHYDDPFRAAEALLNGVTTRHILLDFHGEATSEKIAMAYFLDSRVTAVLGTHTHVATADERILKGGTAAISDVGMTGPAESVLGMDKEIILRRFLTGMPERFEVAKGPGVISGVVLSVEIASGLALSIQRVRWEPPSLRSNA